MIPLRDVIPSRAFPTVTVALIAINSAAFLWELALPRQARESLFLAFGVVPASLHWITLITSMFLHADWLHLLGNMPFLWIFGDNLEDQVGHVPFVLFYVLCGTAATLAHVFMNPNSPAPAIGASGAIAGVMGAYFVLFPQSRILAVPLFMFWDLIEVPAVVFLGIWLVLQIAMPGSIMFWAHIAGFLTGAAMVFLFRKPIRDRWT